MKIPKLWVIILPICLALFGFFVGTVYQKNADGMGSQIINGTVACSSDNDCPAGYVCAQPGPIPIDPNTKQPMNRKVCWNKSSPIPL